MSMFRNEFNNNINTKQKLLRLSTLVQLLKFNQRGPDYMGAKNILRPLEGLSHKKIPSKGGENVSLATVKFKKN